MRFYCKHRNPLFRCFCCSIIMGRTECGIDNLNKKNIIIMRGTENREWYDNACYGNPSELFCYCHELIYSSLPESVLEIVSLYTIWACESVMAYAFTKHIQYTYVWPKTRIPNHFWRIWHYCKLWFSCYIIIIIKVSSAIINDSYSNILKPLVSHSDHHVYASYVKSHLSTHINSDRQTQWHTFQYPI